MRDHFQLHISAVTVDRRPRPRRPRSSRVETRNIADPAAWAAAAKLADGDYSRLVPQPDGSVLVVNRSGRRLPLGAKAW